MFGADYTMCRKTRKDLSLAGAGAGTWSSVS